MKRIIVFLLSVAILFSCSEFIVDSGSKELEMQINCLLDQWHKDAADAQLEPYLALMHENSVYLGTDGTENWTKTEFRSFCEPHFSKGKAWNFTCLERNVYSSDDQQTVFFDEILKTALGPCRGTGLFMKSNSDWKLKQYVLSILVDNKDISGVLELKQVNDSILISNQELLVNTDK